MSIKPQQTTPVVRPHIPVNKVESSMIEGHGYDAARKCLRVTFKGGKSYDYDDVPPELHASLLKAESAGKFINAHIARRFKTHRLEASK